MSKLNIDLLTNKAFEHYGTDSKRAQIMANGLSRTLDSAFEVNDDGTTYVLTGDIPAMWLRDSAAQARPFLALVGENSELKQLVKGVVEMQKRYVLMDPYANAFNRSANGKGHQSDKTFMSPYVWERKYELDSLCYVLQLSRLYFEETQDSTIFDQTFLDMTSLILDVIEIEQAHHVKSNYSFERVNDELLFEEPGKLLRESLPNNGLGRAVSYTGMSWSGFRPSDDACQFGYLVPSNMFAVVELRALSNLIQEFYDDIALSIRSQKLADKIDAGIQEHGIVSHPKFGRVYAYEVDGLGSANLMDDANIPSLLSAPYLGYCSADDEVYQNTRDMILSEVNPFFFKGKVATGIGSPHTPEGYVWPLSIAMKGLTSNDRQVMEECIQVLCDCDADTNLMHESFDSNNPSNYTRPWFSWANCLFSELIMKQMKLDGANL